MNFKEFRDVVMEKFPNAEIAEDNYRQLIIYTNLQMNPDAESEPHEGSGDDYDAYIELLDNSELIPFEGGE